MPSTQSDTLRAYYAELRTIEDDWYDWYYQNQRGIRLSRLETLLGRLEEIDFRYGIKPRDARVYSIGAYFVEQRAIEANWQSLCRKNHWNPLGLSVNSDLFNEEQSRYEWKLVV
jgi:hypothetical protein